MPSAADLFSILGMNTKPTRPVIQTGRVLYSNPKLGYYEIIPDSTINGVDGTIQAIDARSFPFSGSGITVNNPYPTGTPIIYCTFDRNNGEPLPRHEAIILGADKFHPIVSQYIYPSFTLGNDTLSIVDSTDTVQSAYLNIQNIDLIKDRSYNAPLDLCDGDYAITGVLKNSIYVGYGITSLNGSYNNNLTFYTESNGCVFSTGNYYINDSLLGREETYADYNGSASYVKQLAYTTAESFGAVNENFPFKENKKEGEQLYVINETGQFPVYRYQELAGAVCSGRSVSISSYETDLDFNATNNNPDSLKAGIIDVNKDSKPADIIQYGLSSIRTPWDGSVSVNSLHSISLDKDYFIPYATQIATESNTPLEEPADDKEVLADTYSSITGNLVEYATQGASALYEYSKLGVIRRFFNNIRKRVKAWKIRTFSEVSEKLGIEERKLKTLNYGVPSYTSSLQPIQDPVSKQNTLIEALSAFIHISPSGAIVISDGYGAEIRLEGGNITLSPSGDLKILPGRDVIGIVPGRTELVSRDRIDVASDKGQFTIKAEKEAQIVSNKGVVSLESLSEDHLTYISDNKDDAVKWAGAGVVIKSANDLVINGSSISLRRQNKGDKSEGRSSANSGNIIIDSNNGPLVLYGDTVAARGVKQVVMAGGSGAALSLAGSLEFAGSTVNFPGTVTVGGSRNSMNISIPSIEQSGVIEETLNISGASKGALVVNGDVAITGNMEALKASLDTLGVQRCRIVNGAVDNASLLSGLKTPKDAASLNSPVDSLNKIAQQVSQTVNELPIVWGATTAQVLATTQIDMYKAKTSSVISLYYPTTELYFATEFFIMQSRWQRLSEEGLKWGEPNLVNDTMIFPGKEKWVEADNSIYKIVASGYSKEYTYNDMFDVDSNITYSMEPDGSISKKYIVNC